MLTIVVLWGLWVMLLVAGPILASVVLNWQAKLEEAALYEELNREYQPKPPTRADPWD